MTNFNSSVRKAGLLAGTATVAAFMSLTAAPAFAQDAATPAPAATPQADQAADSATPDIVVTGTLFRRTDTETPSPVTVLTSDDLQKRGIQTVQGAIQTLAANNGPALTNSFTANGAFAGGASSVSLRGLTTSSTLVLFDGLRAAYYPLADDGTRNFVDLNTIPDEIVDRVEVLKDGASSTYGADAVAGVVNIITKKQITGLHATAEAGITQRGDGANHRVSATFGYGDLSENGYNFYVSGHYLDSAAIYNRDRDYPFNTDNQTGICYNRACGPNNIENGVTNGLYNGLSTRPDVFIVRPYDATNTTPLGAYQLLNGCGNTTPYTLTDQQLADANTDANGDPLLVPLTPRNVCQQDITHDYGQIEPRQYRWGGSAHATVNLGNSEAYAEFNYERSYSSYTGLASIDRSLAPAGINFPAYTNASGANVLTLPVYICPRGTTVACTAANGTLNPNNPFAAQGQVARIAGRLPTSTEFNSSLSQVYRGAIGVHGTFGGDWTYAVDATAMVNKLQTTAKGYVYIQHLIDEVKDGSYNFVNPSLTSKAALDYLTPTQINHQDSHLYQVQGSIGKDLFQLPGGALQVAVGGAFRHESLNDPSGNPDYNGPTERYFRLNAFGASGSRDVESAYFEINAPIVTQLEVNASGRYDHYSSGQSNFSPKIGAKFTPFKQLAIRGTFSKGFRIPSFAESGALPTTGYVSVSPGSLPAAFVAQHQVNGQNDPYITSYSIGETTVGNPNLKPEKSRNFTVGAIFEPIKNVSFTVDYYNIEKTNAITSVDFQGAIDNYYATGALAYNGVTIIQDEPDIDRPTGQKRVAFAQGSFINANKIATAGLDMGMKARFPITDSIKFTTAIDATYIFYLNTTFPNGETQHYAGTLGNFNLTAGSGTQRWKGSWQSTLDFGKASLTATAYYTSGYNYSAEDQGSVAGDCSLVPTNLDGDAYQACNVKSFVSVDMHGEVKVADKFTLYMDVLNVADRKPSIDATTYGAYLYNPVVGEAGIVGRSFRVGAKVDF
ncbi:MAG: TonB-dependent receptor [Sphingomonas bacterium]